MPTAFQNDANAAAFGEFWAGAGKGVHSMVLFTLGTGVGGGIIIGDLVLEGEHSHGAELGHMKIEMTNPRQCGCGRWGCLEAYASATAVVKRTREALAQDGGRSPLHAVLREQGELTARDIFDAAAAGDALADKIVPRVNSLMAPVNDVARSGAAGAGIMLIGIGASTGGPPVLQTILSGLPKEFPATLLIVQHIARGFLSGMVEWLNQTTGLHVHIAAHDARALPGHAYIAPDDFHLGADAGGRLVLAREPPENGLRPSVSYLFRSLVHVCGPKAVGVLLTGMGTDGAAELKQMRDCGAFTIAQDRDSSIVHGMPGEAIGLGGAAHVLSADKIAAALIATGRAQLSCRSIRAMSIASKSDPTLQIVIAEDSATQAQHLQHILTQHGYHVTATANGRLALEAARRNKPALIISDVIMPEMNGYELCARVKTDARLSDVPVILVTTLSDPHDVIRGLECRADNFILKPYDADQLLHRIQFVLVNSQMRRTEQPGMGLEIVFSGQRHSITADRLQILNLLLSTYEAAMQRNKELSSTRDTLRQTNQELQELTHELEDRVLLRTRELENSNEALRQAQQALIQQERLRALGQMASGIAHDINNAISPIALYTDSLLERETNLSAEARDRLLTIQRAIDDVAQTVARMREFYRPREPELAADGRRAEPARAAGHRSDARSLERSAAATRHHDRAETPRSRPISPIFAAPTMRSAMRFTNLIFNAVDAMPDGGVIEVRTSLSTVPAEGGSSAQQLLLEVSGYRDRHGRGNPPTLSGTVLHHQGRARHRTRSGDGLRDGATAWRHVADRQHTRCRNNDAPAFPGREHGTVGLHDGPGARAAGACAKLAHTHRGRQSGVERILAHDT